MGSGAWDGGGSRGRVAIKKKPAGTLKGALAADCGDQSEARVSEMEARGERRGERQRGWGRLNFSLFFANISDCCGASEGKLINCFFQDL